MKRRYFKYVFIINFIIISCVILTSLLLKKQETPVIPASLTTPIISTYPQTSGFCESAKSAVLIDGKSGAVLYEKNSNLPLPMASTTKIMTALAVIEASKPEDVITVTKASCGIEGSSIYLTEGEQLTVKDLLYGLLLESGNDAASALATGVFGSEKLCVDKMNELCSTMGLIDTSFSNVHGLYDESHKTTAYELALITSHALKNPLFKEIVSTKNYVTESGKMRYFSNHNRLLWSYENAIGVKTGYTSKSGRCLVSSAEKDGELYIAVTLSDSNDWQDHKDMLSFAFDSFDCVEIAQKDSFTVYYGFDKYAPADSIYLTSRTGNDFDISYKFIFSQDICKAEYYYQGTKLGHFPLIKKD